MDSALLWGALAVVYIAPAVIVLIRRPTMPLLIITLDLVLGWSIVGWAAALLLSIVLPRRRDLLARALTAAGPSASSPSVAASGDPKSASFLHDPLTVGVLTFLGSTAYYLWWFWQFFTLAKRERFPRARSFWWIFVPLYGLAVIYRTFEDLELRLPPQMRSRFHAKTALGIIIAGNLWAGFSARFPEPAGIGFFFISGAFFGAAIYMVQGAANAYLRASYPGRVSKATSVGEIAALLVGVGILFLSVAGATLTLKARNQPIDMTASTLATPYPTPNPTPTPTPLPSAGPFPASGNALAMTSEQGDPIGGGVPRTYDQSTATFRQVTGPVPPEGVDIELGTVDLPDHWDLEFIPQAGQALHVGTYQVALAPGDQRPGLRVSGESRGCNFDTGSFTITRIAFNSAGELLAFDATFVQRCEHADAPALRGQLRFDKPLT
jgi:hypothetical protein